MNKKFTEHDRFLIAQELFSGKCRKKIAFEWQISRGHLYEIFHEFIEWKMVWKAEKRYHPLIARDGIEAQYGLNDTWPGDPYETSDSKNT